MILPRTSVVADGRVSFGVALAGAAIQQIADRFVEQLRLGKTRSFGLSLEFAKQLFVGSKAESSSCDQYTKCIARLGGSVDLPICDAISMEVLAVPATKSNSAAPWLAGSGKH